MMLKWEAWPACALWLRFVMGLHGMFGVHDTIMEALEDGIRYDEHYRWGLTLIE